MKKVLLIISILISATACKNNENPNSMTNKTAKEEKKACDLITETEIKNLLAIPDSAVTLIENEAPTHPTCFYTWESVIYTRTRNIGGQDLNLEYPAKASIVLVENANEGMYKASLNAYKDPQGENGIGDMATWGADLSQLTFVAKDFLVHINVKVASDENDNKEKAIKLAKLVIDRL